MPINRATLILAASTLLVEGTTGLASAQIRLPAPTTTYTLTDLSTNNDRFCWSEAYAINLAGQATGQFCDTLLQGRGRAFETQANAQIQNANDLGALTFNGTVDVNPQAVAINRSGSAVGSSLGISSNSVSTVSTYHAFVFVPGTGLQFLNTTSSSGSQFLPNATNTFANGINDAGWIVGWFNIASDNTAQDGYQAHSFLSFGPGFTSPIDGWYGNPAFSATYAVNNKSQLVGFLRRQPTDQPTAFFFDAGASSMHLTNIGALPGSGTLPGGGWSVGYAVNDAGQVVGTSTFAGSVQVSGSTWAGMSTHAFRFQDLNHNGIADPGEIVDLDTMNTALSAAVSINNHGIAVGYFGGYPTDLLDHYSRAAIFENGKMIDLNTLVPAGTGGATLCVAYGINDNGQIVGYMAVPNGDIHAFRLDPIPTLVRVGL